MALSSYSTRLLIAFCLCLAHVGFAFVSPRARLQSPTCSFSTSAGDAVGELTDVTHQEEFVYTKVSLSKPMGLMMEEVEEGEARGVMVLDMASGSALERQLNSRAVTVDSLICIGDVLVEIGNDGNDPIDALTLTFDQVMTILADSPEPVQLTFRRPAHHIAVLFASTGMATACPRGTPVRELSRQTRAPIPYDCNTGYCGTCEQVALTDNGETKYVRPCVASVGSKSKVITIANSDSLSAMGIKAPNKDSLSP